MNCICTYQKHAQALQFKSEFDIKFREDAKLIKENGCYSIYTHSEISKEMLDFRDNDFLLSRENRTFPDLKFWKEKEESKPLV